MRAAEKLKNLFDGLPIAVPAAVFVLLLLFQNFSFAPRPSAMISTFDRLESSPLDDRYLLQTDLEREIASIVEIKPAVYVLALNPAFAMSSPHEIRSKARAELRHLAQELQSRRIQVEILTDLFPVWMTGASSAEGGAIPCPSSGIAYSKFLENYRATYLTLTSELPTGIIWAEEKSVRRWQAYFPIRVGYGSCGEVAFSEAERMKIADDLAKRRVSSAEQVASGRRF